MTAPSWDMPCRGILLFAWSYRPFVQQLQAPLLSKVWVLVKATGTHTGEWNLLGAVLPPTGKEVTLNMVVIWRLEDGKLVEGWEVDADLGFLKELSVVEYTELGKPLEEVFR